MNKYIEQKLEEVIKKGLSFIHDAVRNTDFDLGFKTAAAIFLTSDISNKERTSSYNELF
jgi:hypothetical protein